MDDGGGGDGVGDAVENDPDPAICHDALWTLCEQLVDNLSDDDLAAMHRQCLASAASHPTVVLLRDPERLERARRVVRQMAVLLGSARRRRGPG